MRGLWKGLKKTDNVPYIKLQFVLVFLRMLPFRLKTSFTIARLSRKKKKNLQCRGKIPLLNLGTKNPFLQKFTFTYKLFSAKKELFSHYFWVFLLEFSAVWQQCFLRNAIPCSAITCTIFEQLEWVRNIIYQNSLSINVEGCAKLY